MKLLTEQQIKEIWNMQKSLDGYIRKNNDIPIDKNLNSEKFLALKTELFEFVNEIESFKYWKKNKGKSHILEEACDMLHFIFSIAIDNDIKIVQLEKLVKDVDEKEYDLNELLIIIDDLISDCFFTDDWGDINAIITFLSVVLHLCNFTTDDLYNAYIEKNKVNVERQQNNY